MDYASLLKKYRKKPLVDVRAPDGLTAIPLEYGRDAIERVIPHRDPFLLVDSLTGLYQGPDVVTITGTRMISPDDPVLTGHFPGYPVYPGSLQIEMGGQLGLCLTHFVVNDTTSIDETAKPVQVRATKVLGALFSAPLLPGVEAVIMAQKIEYDGYFGVVLSQVLSGKTVCCTSIAEVIFLDE